MGIRMKLSAAGSVTRRVLPLAAALGFLLLASVFLASHAQSPNRDFISYWSAGRLLAQHANPYSRPAVLQIEHSVGYLYARPLVMRNTPLTLFLFAPLGWFSYATAATLWEMALILAALGSIRLMQPFAIGPIPYSVFFFAPVIDCILAGQSSIFVLLGVSLFIRLVERRPFLAGIPLVLCLLKPHLLAIFWLVLLLEIMRKRQWGVIGGLLAAMLAALLAALVLDPHVWTHYFADLRGEGIRTQFFPNLAYGLRWVIARQQLWPQFIPLVAGLPLALIFWWRRRGIWQWKREGVLLIAGSALVSPYSFHVDEVLFLPAVLYCFTRSSEPLRRVFVAINALAIFLCIRFPSLSSPADMWTGPITMLWLTYAWRCLPACAVAEPEARRAIAAS